MKEVWNKYGITIFHVQRRLPDAPPVVNQGTKPPGPAPATAATAALPALPPVVDPATASASVPTRAPNVKRYHEGSGWIPYESVAERHWWLDVSPHLFPDGAQLETIVAMHCAGDTNFDDRGVHIQHNTPVL
jgi:hypothetical protein